MSNEVAPVQGHPVRLLPQHPLGSAHPDAIAMAERGVRMGRAGLLNGRVTKLMTNIQNTAIEVTNRSLDALLDELEDIRDAQLAGLLDDVRRMPPPRARDLLASGGAGYISREQVVILITQLMGSSTR